MARKAHGLSHAKWVCKYHIVFAPKHGRKVIHSQAGRDVGEMPREPCEHEGVEAMEGRLMPGHVHMLVAIPPKTGVPGFTGYPRGKGALMLFDRHANMRYRFGNRKFWAEGHCAPAAGPDEATIAKYIREREAADIALDRPGVKGYKGPFGR